MATHRDIFKQRNFAINYMDRSNFNLSIKIPGEPASSKDKECNTARAKITRKISRILRDAQLNRELKDLEL